MWHHHCACRTCNNRNMLYQHTTHQVQEQLHVMCQWITALLLCSWSNIIYAFKFPTNFGMGAMSVGYVDDDDDDCDDLLKFKLVCLANGSVLLHSIVIGVLRILSHIICASGGKSWHSSTDSCCGLCTKIVVHKLFTSKKYSVQWVAYVRFEVLMAVLHRIQVFWSVMLCCWVSSFLHCEGLYCLRLQKKSRWWQSYVCTSNCLNKEGFLSLPPSFLLCFTFSDTSVHPTGCCSLSVSVQQILAILKKSCQCWKNNK